MTGLIDFGEVSRDADRREQARRRAAAYLRHADRKLVAGRWAQLEWCAAALFAISEDGNALERAQAGWLLAKLRLMGVATP